jgi:hypothetical protein
MDINDACKSRGLADRRREQITENLEPRNKREVEDQNAHSNHFIATREHL